MTQKEWEIENSKVVTQHICVNCNEHIIHHKHYNNLCFCEECNREIAQDYYNKCKNEEDKEQISHFGWNTVDKFLQSVYKELTDNSDSQYYE